MKKILSVLLVAMMILGIGAAFAKDTEVVFDGFFHESEFRSAPYFDVQLDGIELLNAKY